MSARTGRRAAPIAARVEALRGASIFSGLSKAALTRIARVASEVELPAGHILTERGQKGTGMFVVLEGEVVVEARGKRHAVLGPGDVVGELALLTPAGVRTARVTARTPVRCLALTRADFAPLVARDPKLAAGLLEVVAERLAGML